MTDTNNLFKDLEQDTELDEYYRHSSILRDILEAGDVLSVNYSLPKRRRNYILPKVRITPEKPKMSFWRIMSARSWITFFARVTLISAFGCWLVQFIRGF
jgi:hypothetical protein